MVKDRSVRTHGYYGGLAKRIEIQDIQIYVSAFSERWQSDHIIHQATSHYPRLLTNAAIDLRSCSVILPALSGTHISVRLSLTPGPLVFMEWLCLKATLVQKPTFIRFIPVLQKSYQMMIKRPPPYMIDNGVKGNHGNGAIRHEAAIFKACPLGGPRK